MQVHSEELKPFWSSYIAFESRHYLPDKYQKVFVVLLGVYAVAGLL